LSVTSKYSARFVPCVGNAKGERNVMTGLPSASAPRLIAPLAPKFATSVCDRFIENGTFPPGIGKSFVSMPAGVKVLSVVPVGTGRVKAREVVPAGNAPCTWYEIPTWQVPVPGLVFASEQNSNESIVTPSMTVLDEASGIDAALPYEERVRVGTEFADAVNAKAKIAAKPPSIFSFFT
jgi:hypothetical protein